MGGLAHEGLGIRKKLIVSGRCQAVAFPISNTLNPSIPEPIKPQRTNSPLNYNEHSSYQDSCQLSSIL